MCVCACVCARGCARGWAGACAGGVRFSNSNRIIPSDYRILHLLKMPIPIRHTIRHASIVYPAANVPSGQTGSPEPKLLVEKMVSIALRDQLIKSIISQFEEQCRESLSIAQTILESKQGK